MKSLILAIILLVFLSPSVLANGSELCKGEQSTLNCLKENFDKLYNTDYNLFWDILHDTANKLRNNHNLSHITAFLGLVSIIRGNSEVSEFFSEVTEKLCVSNPTICLDALAMLDEKDMQLLIDRIGHPLYFSKEEIDQVFSRYRYLEKYKEISKLYFNKGR